MGTNYYMAKTCGTCGHEDRKAHLGKSSAGWTFTFRGSRVDGVVDFASWVARVHSLLSCGYDIVNEYGDIIAPDDMFKLIIEKRGERNNHATYVKITPPHSEFWNEEQDWNDVDGNSFSDVEFS